MAKKYIKIKNLSVSLELANFVNKDLLPGTGVVKNKFWSGLDKYAHELSLKNKNLIEFREILQKKN
jgi:malate synthase